MTFEVGDEQGSQALDHNQQATQRNFGVDNGCAVSIGSGELGTGNNALDIAAGDVMFSGASVAVASQSVDIDTGGTNPRKDVVYIDGNGDVVVAKGTPEEAFPVESLGPFEYQRPAPNDLSGTDAVVLAEVWVGADATTVDSSELRDRRVSSRGNFTSLDTDDLGHNIEDLTDVSGSRSLGTEYQNTEDTVRLVVIVMQIDGSSSAETLNSVLAVGNTSGVGDSDRAQEAFIGNYDDQYKETMKSLVPPKGYYKANDFSNGTIDEWREANFR